MRAKIHQAVVTRADLHYEGSIGIDRLLLSMSGLLPGEAVHVWNINNGERFETYVLPLTEGSGEVCVNGAAARMVHAGDRVIVASFCWMEYEAARSHIPQVVIVGGDNHKASAVYGKGTAS